jgi:hypothetical protein
VSGKIYGVKSKIWAGEFGEIKVKIVKNINS